MRHNPAEHAKMRKAESKVEEQAEHAADHSAKMLKYVKAGKKSMAKKMKEM